MKRIDQNTIPVSKYRKKPAFPPLALKGGHVTPIIKHLLLLISIPSEDSPHVPSNAYTIP